MRHWAYTAVALDNCGMVESSTDKLASDKFYKAFVDFVVALKGNECYGHYVGTNSELEQLFWSYYPVALKEVCDASKET